MKFSFFKPSPVRLLITVVTLISGVASIFAQHQIGNILQRLHETGDFDEAKLSLNSYKVEELASLPDSILFDYYYLRAAIYGNDGEEVRKRDYLIVAKDLCEKSLGIHSPVYLELCGAIGRSYEGCGDELSAFEIYQAALIQSIGLYSLSNEDVKWQYDDINEKVIKWYKDPILRRSMIEHRSKLKGRNAAADAVQNDMEFYYQFYKDAHAQGQIQIADSLNAIAQWDKAATIYLELAKSSTHNPIAKATLQELAAIDFMNMEEFQTAETLLLNNLELLKECKKTKSYRRTLSQLSNLYSALHNYSKAKDYATEAKYMYEQALDFSRSYILCLHRCATLERGAGNFFLALILEDVALQELYRNQVWGIIAGSNTTKESYLTDLLSSASLHYNQLGFLSEAKVNIESAIKIAEANNLDASAYYHNLAIICGAEKDYYSAVSAAGKAYKLSQSPNNKIEIGTALCLAQFMTRQPINGTVVRECSQNLQTLTNQTFAFTSINERQAYWSYFEYYFPLLNFLAYQTNDGQISSQIYNNILVEKGLLLRTSNGLRNQILESGCPDDILKYNQMLDLRKLLPFLSNKEARMVMDSIENLDKVLTRKYSKYSDYTRSNNLSWESIREGLSNNDIAIEFYNIPLVSWHEDSTDVDGKYRYCAIVLKKGFQVPKIIPLCTKDDLKNLDREDIYASDLVYNLIWKPLEAELDGIKNIFFSAYGDLHTIGIEYAPLPEGGIMGDKFDLHRLSSTRVLAENRPQRRSEHAVLYGGLRYDVDKDELIAESRSSEYRPTSASRAFSAEDSRYGVKYLPGTLEEVQSICQNFKSKPRLITETKGTEESFKSLSESSYDIIHLATHGFFWTKDDAKRRGYVSFLTNHDTSDSKEDYALMRSGLFFSGANIGLKGENLPDDVEDGVLTALELSNMNLGNVDMVVMSACESGLGETSGEGVFGLQRGFKLAGANTLLMSLWKVDDRATQLLMTEFYRHYLSGKSKRESLHLAQQTLRNSSEYSDPQYWTAFILLDGLN